MECILVGDTGSGYKEQLLVAESMVELIQSEPEIKCVMIVGDNIYPDGCRSVDDRQFIDKFQNPYKDIHLPFYLCLGNHDYSHNPQAQIEYTKSPLNKLRKWNMPAKWYKKSFDPCDFFFIDTNIDKLTKKDRKTQLKDTIRWIQQSKNRWRIVCGHHTWRSVGGHGNAEKEFEEFMYRLCARVTFDLYVCGHDHCKSIIEVGEAKIPTLVIGTGGKRYDEHLVRNRSEASFLDNLKADGSTLVDFSSKLGVCHFKATEDSITLTCYTEKLEEEFEYTISGRVGGGKKKKKARRTKRRKGRKRSKRSRRRRRRN